MAWYDTKQAAVDPDNPAANEQIAFSEWNNMVTYLKDKIIDKTVDDAAIGDDKILVYKTATSTFVFETPSAAAALGDLTNVTISGVPADNEVLAYDTGTSEWINQTAAEAGLATTTQLTALETAAVLEADYNATTFLYATVDNTPLPKTPAEVMAILSGVAGAEFLFNTQNIGGIVDPTTAQQAATKNYCDTILLSKEVVTSFTDGYIPVYRTASGKFEMETFAGYLPLTGGTMTGALDMGDYQINGAGKVKANDGDGVMFLASNDVELIRLAYSPYSFYAGLDGHMGSNKIVSVADPTLAQDAATKNYSDTRLLSKEAVTSFLDGYIPVYRTASGKFEMEDAGGSAGLPVADTTNIVKGSADGTKLMRFEVDGITTGTTRVMTVPDKDLTIADRAEVMLLDGTQAMSNDLDVGYNAVIGRHHFGPTDSFFNIFKGGIESTYSAELRLYGEDYISHNGIDLTVPNAAKSSSLTAIRVYGVTDTPIVDIYYGLDMNGKDVDDIGKLILNDATELTIATGIVNVTQSYHEIDTEGEVATDDLDTVSGGSNGQILVLRAHDNARTVVVKDGTGNLQLAGDMTLDNILDSLTLIFDGTYWIELSRSNNSA